MAGSLADARAKFERKMSTTAGPNYDAAKARMAQNYRDGFSHLGITPGPNITRAYQEGVQATSGATVAQRALAGSQKWEANYRAKMQQ